MNEKRIDDNVVMLGVPPTHYLGPSLRLVRQIICPGIGVALLVCIPSLLTNECMFMTSIGNRM